MSSDFLISNPSFSLISDSADFSFPLFSVSLPLPLHYIARAYWIRIYSRVPYFDTSEPYARIKHRGHHGKPVHCTTPPEQLRCHGRGTGCCWAHMLRTPDCPIEQRQPGRQVCTVSFIGQFVFNSPIWYHFTLELVLACPIRYVDAGTGTLPHGMLDSDLCSVGPMSKLVLYAM